MHTLLKEENHDFPNWKLSWHPVTILMTTCTSDYTHLHFLLAVSGPESILFYLGGKISVSHLKVRHLIQICGPGTCDKVHPSPA